MQLPTEHITLHVEDVLALKVHLRCHVWPDNSKYSQLDKEIVLKYLKKVGKAISRNYNILKILLYDLEYQDIFMSQTKGRFLQLRIG